MSIKRDEKFISSNIQMEFTKLIDTNDKNLIVKSFLIYEVLEENINLVFPKNIINSFKMIYVKNPKNLNFRINNYVCTSNSFHIFIKIENVWAKVDLTNSGIFEQYKDIFIKEIVQNNTKQYITDLVLETLNSSIKDVNNENIGNLIEQKMESFRFKLHNNILARIEGGEKNMKSELIDLVESYKENDLFTKNNKSNVDIRKIIKDDIDTRFNDIKLEILTENNNKITDKFNIYNKLFDVFKKNIEELTDVVDLKFTDVSNNICNINTIVENLDSEIVNVSKDCENNTTLINSCLLSQNIVENTVSKIREQIGDLYNILDDKFNIAKEIGINFDMDKEEIYKKIDKCLEIVSDVKNRSIENDNILQSCKNKIENIEILVNDIVEEQKGIKSFTSGIGSNKLDNLMINYFKETVDEINKKFELTEENIKTIKNINETQLVDITKKMTEKLEKVDKDLTDFKQETLKKYNEQHAKINSALTLADNEFNKEVISVMDKTLSSSDLLRKNIYDRFLSSKDLSTNSQMSRTSSLYNLTMQGPEIDKVSLEYNLQECNRTLEIVFSNLPGIKFKGIDIKFDNKINSNVLDNPIICNVDINENMYTSTIDFENKQNSNFSIKMNNGKVIEDKLTLLFNVKDVEFLKSCNCILVCDIYTHNKKIHKFKNFNV